MGTSFTTESGRESQAGSMEAALHGRQGEAEELGGLWPGHLLEVSQSENLAFFFSEGAEGPTEHVALLGSHGGGLGVVATPAGPEAELEEGHAILVLLVLLSVPIRSVAGDGEEPGLDRRITPEIAGTPVGGDKRLLQDVVRPFGVPDEGSGKPTTRRPVAHDQGLECGAIATCQHLHQLVVCPVGVVGHVEIPRAR